VGGHLVPPLPQLERDVVDVADALPIALAPPVGHTRADVPSATPSWAAVRYPKKRTRGQMLS